MSATITIQFDNAESLVVYSDSIKQLTPKIARQLVERNGNGQLRGTVTFSNWIDSYIGQECISYTYRVTPKSVRKIDSYIQDDQWLDKFTTIEA